MQNKKMNGCVLDDYVGGSENEKPKFEETEGKKTQEQCLNAHVYIQCGRGVIAKLMRKEVDGSLIGFNGERVDRMGVSTLGEVANCPVIRDVY